jgi:diaminopimelate epimerase
MATELYRVSGAGNDFLALIEPTEAPSGQRIQAWCTRGLSLGADGVFALHRSPGGVRMDYWNADGLPADLCLNGTRCAARLALELGWAAEEVSILTGAGAVLARRAGPTMIALEVPPFTSPLREMSLEIGSQLIEGIFAIAGVPHFVVRVWGSLGAVDLPTLGPVLRSHPAFGKAGANVDWLHVRDPHHASIRTFERGVEAETLACGTGALAAAAAGLLTRATALPLTLTTASGFELIIDGIGQPAPLPERWILAGDARILAHCQLTEEASLLPTRPAW